MSRSGDRPSWRREGDERRFRAREERAAPGRRGELQRLTALATAAVIVTVVAVAYGAYALAVSGSRYAALEAETDPVVVATSDLEAGEVITADRVEVREVPLSAIPDGAARDVARVVGKAVVAPVPGGGVVSDRVLAGESADRLSGRIGEGKVAVSVTVNQQTGVAGLIHQGDAVCVLGCAHSAQDASAAVLARHAKVLALDSSLDLPDDAYTAVTLEVTQAEAESIASALSAGQVSCALEPVSLGATGREAR